MRKNNLHATAKRQAIISPFRKKQGSRIIIAFQRI